MWTSVCFCYTLILLQLQLLQYHQSSCTVINKLGGPVAPDISDYFYPRVTAIATTDYGIFVQPVLQEQSVDVVGKHATISLQCQARYPVEWIVTDPYPAKINIRRSWYIDSYRSTTFTWNASDFLFLSVVTFNSDPSIDNPICKQVGPTFIEFEDIYLANLISARIHDGILTLTSNRTSVLVESNSEMLISNYEPDADNCTMVLEYHKDTNMICCKTTTTTETPTSVIIENIDCYEPVECRSFYKKSNCLRQVSSRAPTTSTTEAGMCLNGTSLSVSGHAGVISCRKSNGNTSMVNIHYFTSVADLCNTTDHRKQRSSLYLNTDMNSEGIEATMLTLCPLENTNVYIGEQVELNCIGSRYYFSGQLRFVVRRKNSAGLITEELVDKSVSAEIALPRKKSQGWGYTMENTTTRHLTFKIKFNDTSVFEIVCIAPPHDRFEWVNKTQSLNVTEPTMLDFLNKDFEEIVLVKDALISCKAIGDPPPLLSWHDIEPDSLEILSNNKTNEILLKIKSASWHWNFTIRCQARQDRIGQIGWKTFRLKQPDNRTEFLAGIGGGIGGLLLILFIAFSIILWRMQDRWRNLNDDEFDEFFNGKPDIDNEQPGNGDVLETNAWNYKYETEYELSSNELRIGQAIGKGEFGKIYLGTLKKVNLKNQTVAVKKNIPYLTSIDFKASLYELKLLIYLGVHENIVRLIGAKTGNVRKRQVLVVLEYCEFGDLKSYLCKNRNTIITKSAQIPNSGPQPRRSHYITSDELMFANIVEMGFIKWAVQILNGLIFLGTKKVIHGDLAARNILLNSASIAKISDFGMAHQVTRAHYAYMVSPHTKKPWYSSAPECLERCEYSIKSDVCSFGVILWEIFSLGEDPWANVGCEDMLRILKNGGVLPVPRARNREVPQTSSHEITLVTSEIYDKMKQCVRQLTPNERPTFEELHEYFEGLAACTSST